MAPFPRRPSVLRQPRLLATLGVLAGFLSGMLGIGGGLVVGPALVAWGVPLKRATGSALAVVAPVALIGVLTELVLAPQHVHWLAGVWIAAGGQMGAYLGARLLTKVPDRSLRWAFTALILYAAWRNLSGLDASFSSEVFPSGEPTSFYLLGLGALAGLCTIFFGVGGGVVVVPGLTLFAEGYPITDAMATSLFAMVFTAAQGVRLAQKSGRIGWPLVRTLAPAALVACVFGVWLREVWAEAQSLSTAFGLFLLFVALRLNQPALRNS